MELQEIDFSSPLIFSSLNQSSSFRPDSELDGPQPLKENVWGFNCYVWEQVQTEFQTVDRLYAAIQDLHDEIKRLKEQFRKYAIDLPDLQVERNGQGGVSGSYFLFDNEGNRKYLIKPLDEDAGCIHSPTYSTPFTMSPIRAYMPLYRSSMREVLAYQIASMIGVSSIMPKTEIGVITSSAFYNFSESIFVEERKRYYEMCGYPESEKLCSVQEYVPNSKSLFEALHDFQTSSLSDEEIGKRFDQRDFEEANILLWTTYDTDAHSGNFLVYPKGVDEIGNEILGLKKIDNGLAFPDANRNLRNNLSYLPNAKEELSTDAKEKVLAIDVDRLAAQFEKMGLASAVPALRERIPILQKLVQQEGMTIKKINKVLSKIGKKQ